MIQNTRVDKRPRIKLRPSEKLRSHFLALARQVNAWHNENPRRFSVGVASVETGQGASTVAFNLTAALAGLVGGKVILVETEFGNPFASRRLPRRCSGLSEVLSNQTEARDGIYPTRLEQMYVMGCGKMAKRNAQSLPLESITALNREMQDEFALAIFDLPGISDVSHFYPLANQLDGVILVVDANQIDAKKIDRVRRRLASKENKIIGVVVNKAN